MSKDQEVGTSRKYSTIAKILHWSVAALVALDFLLAISFSRFNPGDALYLRLAYPLHMSIGMAALAFAIAFVLRLRAGYSQPGHDASKLVRVIRRSVQAFLYASLLVVPLTGWAILSLRSRTTPIFGSLDLPPIPTFSALPISIKRLLHGVYLPLHRVLGYTFMVAVSVHVAAALYHHVYRRDPVLKQMLPQFKFHPSPISPRSSNDNS